MKTVWGILVFVLAGFVIFNLANDVMTKKIQTGTLDEESLNLYSIYTTEFNNSLKQNVTTATVDETASGNLNDKSDFFKEYSDTLTRAQQLTNTLKMIYELPDLILLSIPFVEEQDLSLYRGILWALIIPAIILTAIIIALGQRKLTEG